eukprot:Gb_03458 [translate_table: standard]
MGDEKKCDGVERDTAKNEFTGTKHWKPMSLDTLSPRDDARQIYNSSPLNYYCQNKKMFTKMFSLGYPLGSLLEISKRLLPKRNIPGPCTLSTEGIENAKPLSLYKYTNRGLYANSSLAKKWEDLEKNKPQTWIPVTVNRPFTNLTLEDIQGTHPNPKPASLFGLALMTAVSPSMKASRVFGRNMGNESISPNIEGQNSTGRSDKSGHEAVFWDPRFCRFHSAPS